MNEHARRKEATVEQARAIHETLRMVRGRAIAGHTAIVRSALVKGRVSALTSQQAHALMVAREQGKVSITGLSNALGGSPSSASTIVDRLLEKGLVTREISAVDRRRVMVVLSPEGETVAAQIEAQFVEAIRGVLERIGPECARKVCEVCLRVRQVLLEDQGEPRSNRVEGKVMKR